MNPKETYREYLRFWFPFINQGESSAQSESHKSDSEDEGVEIEEEEAGHIVVDNNEPPCKLARKQLIDGVHCDGSSTDTELDGMYSSLLWFLLYINCHF